jgi:hypothetical protein
MLYQGFILLYRGFKLPYMGRKPPVLGIMGSKPDPMKSGNVYCIFGVAYVAPLKV